MLTPYNEQLYSQVAFSNYCVFLLINLSNCGLTTASVLSLPCTAEVMKDGTIIKKQRIWLKIHQ